MVVGSSPTGPTTSLNIGSQCRLLGYNVTTLITKKVTMSENKLRDDIEKLRDEIKTLSTDEDISKEKLENLLQEIESGLETDSQNNRQPELLAGLKESVGHFETEHPRVTAIINDIMVTLSNMGI